MHAVRRTPLRLLVLSRPGPEIASIHTARQVGGPTWTPPGRYRRKTPPRRKDVPLFEISERVLDLDAEDNPSVRPYDESTDGAEAVEKWRHAYDSIDATAEYLKQHDAYFVDMEARGKATASMDATAWHVTDHDIWSLALLGSSEVLAAVKAMEAAKAKPSSGSAESTTGKETTTTAATLLARVLYENGISGRSPFERDSSSAMRRMLHCQQLAAETTEDAKENGPLRAERAWDKAFLGSCASLAETRRLLAHAGRSPAGRAALVRNDRALADRLLAYLTTEKAAATVSAMLLNASYCSDLGPRLCAVGLQAAAATGEPAAVQRFLSLGLGQPPKQMESAAVVSALNILLAQLRGEEEAGTLHGSRADVLQLLTGATGLRAALLSTSTKSSSSSSSLAAVLPTARNAYLAAIAELGCVHTLWEEQHAPGTPDGLAGEDDILVTGVLRYAQQQAQTQADTGSAGAAAPLATLRPAPWRPWKPSRTPPPTPTDDAFRADVVRAFSEETPAACVAAVDKLLARHGGLRSPIMA